MKQVRFAVGGVVVPMVLAAACGASAPQPSGAVAGVEGLGTVDFRGSAPGERRPDGPWAVPGSAGTAGGPGWQPLQSVFGPTVVISRHGLGIRESGQVVAWGANNAGQATVPAGLGDVAAVASGQNHSYALRTDGTLRGWGENIYLQLNVPSDLGAVRTLEVGADTNVALRADATVRLWGCENCPFDFGTLNVPPGLSGVVEVDAEGCLVLVRLGSGQVVGWGCDTPANWPFPPVTCGQAQPPAAAQGAIQIAAGTLHGLALKADGTVVAWGATCPESDYGQAIVPAGLTNVVQVAAGAQHSLALRADGTVVGWGLDALGQATVPAGLSNVVAIDAKLNQSLALRADGSLVAWGSPSSGINSPPAGPFKRPVPGGCYPNCDGSTGAAVLTPADFVCFLSRFRAGDAYANCDGSTGTPSLTPADFVCFLNRFRAGC